MLVGLGLVGACVPVRAELVGRIDAEVAVSEAGAARYSVAISVPPGSAGVQPALSLEYDSQAGNGPLGVGFALGGLSAITRCPSDLARDGRIRAVALDAEDRLCLDGERLVLAAGAYGASGSVYATERESFARVTAHGAGPQHFEVRSKDGRIRFYGSTDDSRVEAQSGAIRAWALARVEDRAGNAIRFRYDEDVAAGEHRLARVDYTENAAAGVAPFASVRLVWESRPDPEVGFLAGARIASARRLVRIETYLQEERVREYRLEYEQSPRNGRSRLASLTLCGLAGECLRPTRFTWLDGAPGFAEEDDWALPRQLWRDSRQEATLADVDGDGRIDLLHENLDGTALTGWLNTGSGFASAPQWRPPEDLFHDATGLPLAQLTDLNGDGLVDYARSFQTASGAVRIATYLNQGDGFAAQPDPAWATPTHLYDYQNDVRRQRAFLIDLNGDALPDLVKAFRAPSGSDQLETRLNTGSGFGAPEPRWTLPVPLWDYSHDSNRTRAALVDVNGDALPDLVQAWRGQNPDEHLDVWLNDGAGFTGPVAQWRPPHRIWDYNQASWLRQEAQLADLNADGLPDFVVAYKHDQDTVVIDTYLNTGAGWLRDPAWDLPHYMWNYEGSGNRQTAQLADVNGDGFPDLVRALIDTNGAHQRHTWLNSGHGFPAAAGTSPEYAAPETLWSFVNGDPRSTGTFADLDADGVADAVKAFRSATTALRTHLGASPAGDRIAAITDGLGGRIELEYAPLTDPSVYELGPRALHPQVSVVDTRSVVRRLGVGPSVDALRWSTYAYGGLRADRLRRSEIGFGWREIADEASGVATLVTYRQDWPFHGLVDVAERRLVATGAVLGREEHAYEAVGGTAPGSRALRQIESLVEARELDGALVRAAHTARSFDAFGNPVDERTDLGGGYTRHTRTTVANDAASWLLGLPARIEVTASAPGSPSQTRVRELSYDARGLLIRRVLEPDRPELRVQTDFTRDAFGHAVAETTSGLDFATRVAGVEFDPLGRFSIREQDAEGHVRDTTTDARFGVATSLRGPDPSVPASVLLYDELGRLTATVRPDGLAVTTTRSFCTAQCPPEAVVLVRSEAPGSPVTALALDALGRELRSTHTGSDGREVRVDTHYDLRGNRVARTRPYFEGEAAHQTSYEWDALDRPTRVLSPDGADTRFGYAPLRSTITDALGRVHTEIRDPRGELVESIDALGSRTSYLPDAFGNLILVRDPAGNETQLVYDAAGRCIASDDPDLGAWSFAYDALGQLVARQDARGTYTRLRYDRLGRIVERSGDGPTVRWTYDVAEHGVGRLARVETPSTGFSREERYDAFGRPVGSTTRIAQASYAVARTYDAFGRLGTLRYPGGFMLRHEYTPSGHLDRVHGVVDGVVYWRAESRDAEDRVERERLGNGLITDRIFDPESGRLREILTGDGATAVQSLGYDWDARGNLLGREDRVAGRLESFAYDALDRLVAATLSGAGTTSFAYDALGNLTYKTGVGGYEYPQPGQPQPHAVQRTSQASYAYDANGNLIGDSSSRALVWSPRNQPEAILHPAAPSWGEFFGYGPDGELLTRLEIGALDGSDARLTVSIGDLFELETDLVSRRTEQRSFVYADGALVAVRVAASGRAPETRYAHRDHLESVDTVTDAAGGVLERISYDAHGARRAPPSPPDPGALAPLVPRGFTGHVPLRRSGLVHMKGRVYDPRIGRFLSPDPYVGEPRDPQALNRYAYVRNNPLAFVDPTGHLLAGPPSAGASPGFIAGFFGWTSYHVGNAVAAAGSYLSSAWGTVRFAATAAWNGIAWAGSGVASGARALGGAAVAGASWAWKQYNDWDVGILPDRDNPGGLLQSIYSGFDQFLNRERTPYRVTPVGDEIDIQPYSGEIRGGNIYLNGQRNSLEYAAERGAELFGDEPFILLYGSTVNLISDTIESALLKLTPSRASLQTAAILRNTTEPVHLISHSQGTLDAFWGLRLAGGRLHHVSADFVGAAVSSATYGFALVISGAHAGRLGYAAHVNDPVPNLLGGNFTGGPFFPLLQPVRVGASVLSIPLLPFPEISPHSRYP